MLANRVADSGIVDTVFDAYVAVCRQLATLDVIGLNTARLLALQSGRERCARITAMLDHRIMAALMDQTTALDIGERNWAKVLVTRMNLGEAEAKQRVAFAEDLGPRYQLDGEQLEPALPNTAAALAEGAISVDHVVAIQAALKKAAAQTDPPGCRTLEATLATAARDVSPAEVAALGERAVYLMNQDGKSPDGKERKRGFAVGKQGPDGLSPIRGYIDAETAGYLHTLAGPLAARGINNPDDPEPINPLLTGQQPSAPESADDTADSEATVTDDVDSEDFDERRAEFDDGTSADPSPAARDTRTKPQRNHDALTAILRHALMSGRLGTHNGLPVTLIISTTLSELAAKAGIAVTQAGTAVVMRDVIRLAGHSEHYLAIYDDHKNVPLYLARTRRIASLGQRLVMVGRDRGCTKPRCTRPAADCQGMHVDQDWIADGQTDITNLGLGCGCDNRLAFNTGWTTTTGADGRVHWHPPPLLDTGQDTLNHFHHPEALLNRHAVDP